MIDVVTATRGSEDDFWNASPLGLSLGRLMSEPRINAVPAYQNKRPLPEIYNQRIEAEDAAEYLLFIHDDVWLDDYFVVDRIVEGLSRFDVIGLAGNKRRREKQPAWGFINPQMQWEDRGWLSGSVAHGKAPFGLVTTWGAVPAECELMDGLFLAAKRDVLRSRGVRFDPRFDFHFYDMDFCRTARKQELRLGTWPICVTHVSNGAFGTPRWREMYEKYLEKWGD